jgi:hypothetical protein
VVLTGLAIGDEPQAWTRLGFGLADDRLSAGGVTIRLAGRETGEGILGWSLSDGVTTVLPAAPPAPPGPENHPNGVCGVDHVVAVTGDFGAALAALEHDGMQPRRIRELPGPGDRRQAFFVLGPALLELAGPAPGVAGVAFWGLTFVVSDLEALARRLGERLGEVRDAVQPGRRIATLRRSPDISVPLAFMTPR